MQGGGRARPLIAKELLIEDIGDQAATLWLDMGRLSFPHIVIAISGQRYPPWFSCSRAKCMPGACNADHKATFRQGP